MIQTETKQSRSLRSLARQFCVSVATVHRWSKRDGQADISSRPRRCQSAFTPGEQKAILALRQEKRLALDDLLDEAEQAIPSICRRRASVHRLLVRHNTSRLKTKAEAEAEVKPAGSFKEYALASCI